MTDYIKLKIKNCRKLMREATSDAQREAYKEFLDFWKSKIEPEKPKKKDKKKTPDIKKIIDAPEPEPEPPKQTLKEVIEEFEDDARIEEPAGIIGILPKGDELVTDLPAGIIGILPKGDDFMADELVTDLPETPINYAEEFEKEFPNKMAYRRKDGKLVETIAFKEFLKR